MSDYTPKREKDTIDAAVTSASKVPGSLTLNELNAISDKGLVVSGGGSSSPVGLAKVKFVADDPSMKLKDCFAIYLALPVYYPSHGHFSETGGSYSPDFSIGDWNADMYDGNGFLITPYTLYKKGNDEYTLEGNAEFGTDSQGEYIYITGDCTITFSSKQV